MIIKPQYDSTVYSLPITDIKNLTVSESTIHSICQKNLESWKKVNGNELFDNAKTYNVCIDSNFFYNLI